MLHIKHLFRTLFIGLILFAGASFLSSCGDELLQELDDQSELLLNTEDEDGEEERP